MGWIKRGPSGVIGTNKKDAADTVAKVVADAEAGRAHEPARTPIATRLRRLARRARARTPSPGRAGRRSTPTSAPPASPHGRPRVKLVRLDDLVEAGRASGSAVG